MELSTEILKECDKYFQIRSEISSLKIGDDRDLSSLEDWFDRNRDVMIRINDQSSKIMHLCGDSKLAEMYCELCLLIKQEKYELASNLKSEILNYGTV